jgi:predicted dehydrogenase
MAISQHVRTLVRPWAERLGIVWPLLRERRALHQARLDVAARLRGRPGRLALVGCGAMGATIARAVRHLEGWTVAVLHDRRPEAASRLAAAHPGAEVAVDLDAFLRVARGCDVTAIATTADAHAETALAVLAGGIRAILLEKPVTTSLADADRLLDAASAAGARVAVDHTRRWLPSGEGIRRLLAGDVLGRPRAIHAVFGRAGFAMIGTHLFDLARWLLDADLTRLRAELDPANVTRHRGSQFEDHAGRCEARLGSGARLTLDLSGDLPLQQMFLVVACERGRLEIDERLGHLRLVGTGGRAWDAEYVFPDALGLGVAAALAELAAGRPPRCSLVDGRAALEAAIACQVSARRAGAWVDLPLPAAARGERFAFA